MKMKSSSDMFLDLVGRYLEEDTANNAVSVDVSTTNNEKDGTDEVILVNIRGTPEKASSLGASIGRSALVKHT